MKSPDEINDELCAQVEREMPTPPEGFASEEDAEQHRDLQEQRFFELVRNYPE